MTSLEFCPGHLLGRIGMLEHYLEQLKALHDMFSLQARKVTDEGEADEDAVTLFGLIRLGHDLHEEFEHIARELREIAEDGQEKERQARAAAKAQGKEG